jgi:two-component sensor histidine kinase
VTAEQPGGWACLLLIAISQEFPNNSTNMGIALVKKDVKLLGGAKEQLFTQGLRFCLSIGS